MEYVTEGSHLEMIPGQKTAAVPTAETSFFIAGFQHACQAFGHDKSHSFK